MRNLTVILTTLTMLTLAGCGDDASDSASQPQAEDSATTEAPATPEPDSETTSAD